jgi:NADH dehydrogenase
MHVLVTGGTGFVGRNLCAELVERGHDVTALSRRPNDRTMPEGVETVVGDVEDYESLVDPVSTADAVVNLVALSPLFKPKGGKERHFEVHLEGTKNVVRAAEAAGVDRYVQMSFIGADPNAKPTALRAKGVADEAVMGSDLDWTILRPSVIFGDGGEFISFTKLLTTPYLAGLPGGGRTRFQPIWIDDLVAIVAQTLESDEHVGEIYEIGGPEVLTLGDVTELAYAAEGKPVTILSIPMPLARLGLRIADPLPFVPFGVDQYLSLDEDNVTHANDIEAFGMAPEDLRTLRDYLGLE